MKMGKFWMSMLFISLGMFTMSFDSPPVHTIIVDIEGIKSDRGSVVLAIFDKESDFLIKDYWSKSYPIAGRANFEVKIDDIPAGEYAISIFHDKNDNGELDTNFIGVPKEPYGFSNNPKVGFRPPTFVEAKFQHQGNSTELEISFN
jgi:uncharacterized protein (DUF2141 family)